MQSRITAESEKAWSDFLRNVETLRKRLGCSQDSDCEAWFRGHTVGNHQLLPSLLRKFDNPNNGKTWKKIFDTESDLFWEFSARARELHGWIENDWDILFAMQHYGTPTRLLDWTEILGVVVYFATLGIDQDRKSSEDTVPCVWVLNPYALNEASGWGYDLVYPPVLGWDKKENDYYTYGELLMEGYMDWRWPVAIYPRQRNARIHAQRAWFTIHGDEFIPLNKMDDARQFLGSVELPFAALPSAKRFL